MATATVPYGQIPHPVQGTYQTHPGNPEYHALKKTYLGLLPPQQIIEICLTFEAYAPLHIHASVWPADLKAAIAALQPKTSPLPTANAADNPPEAPTASSITDAPQSIPPEKPPEGAVTAPQNDNATSGALLGIPGSTLTTVPSRPPPPPPIAQPAFPHQPYGSTHQASYPHAPYYNGQAASSYAYPSTSYSSYSASTSSFSHTTQSPNPFPNSSTTPLPPHSADMAPPDLPSYEEIIAEALMECADPEGAAPKNIFTWMSSRYPLQSNFRPSASQALQKAYKRGRFEKSSNGKYRLSPLWEGGSSTRRTRRPASEKQNQHNGAAERPRSSPFTRAPLQPKSTATTQPLFPGQAGYAYTYPPPPPQTYPGNTPDQYPSQANGQEEDTGEGSDAWEAAQNILKAINFGSLMEMGKVEEKRNGGDGGNDNTAGGQNHPPPVIASANMDVNSMSRSTQASETSGHPSGAVLTPEDRASLQAQLALLAAQMAELAEGGDDSLISDSIAFDAITTKVDTKDDGEEDGDGDEDEDEDDDEDMEMVDVPVAAPSAVLST